MSRGHAPGTSSGARRSREAKPFHMPVIGPAKRAGSLQGARPAALPLRLRASAPLADQIVEENAALLEEYRHVVEINRIRQATHGLVGHLTESCPAQHIDHVLPFRSIRKSLSSKPEPASEFPGPDFPPATGMSAVRPAAVLARPRLPGPSNQVTAGSRSA